MELEKYELMYKIGEGSYGVVYKAREKATNRIIALKEIKKVSIKTYIFLRDTKDCMKFLRNQIQRSEKEGNKRNFLKNATFT